MKELLNGVYIRIEWASEHIGVLKDMQRSIEYIDPNTVRIQGHMPTIKELPDGRKEIITPWIDLGEPISDPKWSRELGYAVFNLRAALDYLVYALAFLDSGVEQKGTQFPICSSQSSFKKGVERGHLRGVNPSHKAAIQALQPYNGGNWLKHLASLSNPDKHMHLISVASQNFGTFDLSSNFNAETNRQTVRVHIEVTRFIAFPDKSPVIPLLDALHSQVADTVNQFHSDF
jgi:hypothetical protein